MKKRVVSLILGVFLALSLGLASSVSMADPVIPQPPLPIPTITIPGPVKTIIEKIPGPVRTIVSPVPGPTVTKTIRIGSGPTKTVFIPGPTRTVRVPQPVRTITVTPAPAPTPTTVVKHVPGPKTTITVSVPRFIGISVGFLLVGLAGGLLAMYLAYIVGYKDSDLEGANMLKRLHRELFGKRQIE